MTCLITVENRHLQIHNYYVERSLLSIPLSIFYHLNSISSIDGHPHIANSFDSLKCSFNEKILKLLIIDYKNPKLTQGVLSQKLSVMTNFTHGVSLATVLIKTLRLINLLLTQAKNSSIKVILEKLDAARSVNYAALR